MLECGDVFCFVLSVAFESGVDCGRLPVQYKHLISVSLPSGSLALAEEDVNNGKYVFLSLYVCVSCTSTGGKSLYLREGD